jgi:phage N-6-adenine-methyltransferase
MSAPGNVRRADGINDMWQTPPEIWNSLHEEFAFIVDLAADEQNHLTREWCSGPCKAPDECHCGTCAWIVNAAIWCNPPYSELPKMRWTRQFYRLSMPPYMNTVVALLPVSTSTAWWKEMTEQAHELRFLDRRIAFVCGKCKKAHSKTCEDPRPPAPTGGNAIAIYRPGRRCGPLSVAFGWWPQ